MKYDDIYAYVGEMGLFQKCVCAGIFFFSLFGLDSVQMIFIGAEMEHWCLIPELSNLSDVMQKNIGCPAHRHSSQKTEPSSNHSDVYGNTLLNQTMHDVTAAHDVTVVHDVITMDEWEYSSCSRFNVTYDGYSYEELLSWNRQTFIAEHNPTALKCQHWTYDKSTFTSTIVSRFDLVCGYAYLNQLSSTLFMIGSLVGGVIAGVLADKIGRKKSMIIFLVVKIVTLLLCALSPVYAGFAVGRFILGIGSSACGVNAYVLLMEIVGPSYRSFAGCGIQLTLSVGFLLQPLIAYVTRNDVIFQLIFVVPNVITVVMMIFIPESPRWLIVVGRYNEADRVFRKMCRTNGTKLPEDFVVTNIEKDEGEGGNYLILLRSARMRWRTIIMNLTWFTSSLIYFAMAFNVGYLPGDIFVNTALSSGLEIPAIICCIFLLDWKRLGRRWSSVWTFILTGVLIVVCIPIDLYAVGDGRLALTVLNIVGKGVAVTNFAVLFVYAAEIYPTEVRNSAMGVAQMFNYLGGVVSPYIGAPLTAVWIPLPYLILGLGAILSGLACIVLPETRGQPLHDTVEQAERNEKEVTSDRLLLKSKQRS